MTIILLILAALATVPRGFTRVEGFRDLDETATPARFGLLLVAGEDSIENGAMADLVTAAACSLPECSEVDLFFIDPDASEYGEILALCSDSIPAVMVLVGHCGYIQLDCEFLLSEVLDSWYSWGSADSRRTGICNFCRRCNP